MAELVHKHTEEMLPELEQLQRVQIFSPKEIKAIVKKRSNFEYKLVRRTKQKQDFLTYIKYEIDLLALIHNRRTKIQYFFKKDEIEYSIVSRIHRLFKQVTFRWASDLQLWMSHAAFCINWSKRIQLSKLCTKFLQIHGNKPQMWILAAKWEFECCNSMEKSRLLFMRAIKLHGDDKKLWLEFFRAELIFAEKMRRRLLLLLSSDASIEDTDGAEGKLINGDAARIVYRNATKSFPHDARFHSKFLNITTCFVGTSPFATDIMKEIQADLEQTHPIDATARSVLAQLHLNPNFGAMTYRAKNEELQQMYCDSKCWEAFEKAIVDVDSVDMWREYIDCALSLCGENDQTNQALGASDEILSQSRLQKAINVIIKAHSEKKISVESYPKLIQFLLRNGLVVKSYEILDEVCNCHLEPNLLLMRIDLCLELCVDEENQSSPAEINKLFHGTSKHVKIMTVTQQRQFWTVWMKYAIASDNLELAKSIVMQISADCSSEVTSPMINLYLKWIALSSDAHSAFQVFLKEICAVRTPPLEQYQSMLDLVQSSRLTADSVVEECFELTLRAHGASSPDLWLKYIQYCQESGNTKATSIGKIYWRAKKNLKPTLVERFIAGFTLLGHNSAPQQ